MVTLFTDLINIGGRYLHNATLCYFVRNRQNLQTTINYAFDAFKWRNRMIEARIKVGTRHSASHQK